MSISRLVVTNLRNIDHIEMLPVSGVNIIVGANGSGKTTLLEAIHLLGRARSFKTSKHQVFIQSGKTQCTVFGEIQAMNDVSLISAGVSKAANGVQVIKIAGEKVTSATALIELLPLQIIDPDVFKLLAGGPVGRRQFIDWGVFHVEHSFFQYWQRLNRCLKQRNELLRRGKINLSVMAVWDKEFVHYAELLTQQRKAYVELLTPIFDRLIGELSDIKGLSLSFYRGWNENYPLAELLPEMLARDSKRGFTHVGPQRADLRVRYLDRNAGDILSRGQQKLVICALKIAQGFLFSQTTGRPCIYLLDDLAAELDRSHRERLCRMLSGLNCQLFITSVDKDTFNNCWQSMQVKVFHVEQGTLVS